MKKLSKSIFIKKVTDTIRQYDMLRKGDKVLVAVSGGPDSVSLLEALVEIGKKMDLGLVVGHFDHSIRGAESKKDSDFVKTLAGGFGLEFAHKKENVISARARKRSLEEYARERRYNFLKEAALEHGCNVIATGHTLDDQAETVVMRFITGSTMKGMAGIPAVRYEGGIRLVRPLIRVSKEEIFNYLRVVKRDFCEDRTNRDMKYVRNSVRYEIIPFLEKYNPQVKRAILNLSESVNEDLALIGELKKNLSGPLRPEKENPYVLIRDIILQPSALRREIFKELFIRAGGDVKRLTYRHWKEVDYLVKAGEKGSAVDLPGGVRVSKAGYELVFRKSAPRTPRNA